MHARPASLIVQTISKFKSNVLLKKETVTANGRSIMSVMMLAAENGSELTILADGEDEKEVVEAIIKLIEDRFYED
jgi:phosphocarrier protein